MKKISKILLLSLCWTVVVCGLSANADVEQHLMSTIKLSDPAIDMDVTEDGETICILDTKGNVFIYNHEGELMHKLVVGNHITQIKIGSDGEELFLYDKEKAEVQIVDLVYVYDIDISGSPFKGPADAAVTVVVFSDFQCPYCAKVANYMEAIVTQYPVQVKYVFKHYPLTSHKFAATAAYAAVAAQDQGKFWEFHDLLFKNYNRLDDKILEEIQQTLKLDKTTFENKMRAPETIESVQLEKEQGRNIGVTGTPAVFVNGKKVARNTYDAIKSAIQAELAKTVK